MVKAPKWKSWISPRALLLATTVRFTSGARLVGGLWSGFRLGLRSALRLRRGLAVGAVAAGLSIGLILAGQSFISTIATESTEMAHVAGPAGQAGQAGQRPEIQRTQSPNSGARGPKPPGFEREPGGQGAIQGAMEAMKTTEATETMMEPVNGEVAVGFGWVKHPLYDDWRYNGGWDIATVPGEEVRAALSGVVTDVDTAEGGPPEGRRVVLLHDNGVQTIYDHCEEILVGKGEEVQQGSVIGRVYDGGEPIGPCLHFEVHKGGKPVDPGAFLRLSPRR